MGIERTLLPSNVIECLCTLHWCENHAVHPCVAGVIGGHWSSGIPYLKSSLKTKWDPTGASSKTLVGVQLLLVKADILTLKVATPLFRKAGNLGVATFAYIQNVVPAP